MKHVRLLIGDVGAGAREGHVPFSYCFFVRLFLNVTYFILLHDYNIASSRGLKSFAGAKDLKFIVMILYECFWSRILRWFGFDILFVVVMRWFVVFVSSSVPRFVIQVAGSYFEALGYFHVAHVTPGFHRYRRIEGPGRVGDFWILKFILQVAGSYFEALGYFDMAHVTPVCHRYRRLEGLGRVGDFWILYLGL